MPYHWSKSGFSYIEDITPLPSIYMYAFLTQSSLFFYTLKLFNLY